MKVLKTEGYNCRGSYNLYSSEFWFLSLRLNSRFRGFSNYWLRPNAQYHTGVCVFFCTLSLDFIFILSQNIQLFIVWYDTLLHDSICQVATDNVPSIVHVAIGVFCSLCIFFSQRMSSYDVLLCRVAATDSQFARRPSPMTVCFCTSLSIFFVLSQRIRFLYCYYLSVGYALYGFLYNMYREKRIAT